MNHLFGPRVVTLKWVRSNTGVVFRPGKEFACLNRLLAACLLSVCQFGWTASSSPQCPGEFSVLLHEADPVEMPGAATDDPNFKDTTVVDCNSPVHWDGDSMYLFNSGGHPYRSSGPDMFHLSRPAQRTTLSNEAGWKMGGRWIEATHKAKDGTLYMWYHNEPPVVPGKTAPRIGSMVSNDNGLTWRDLGIVLEAPAGSNNNDSANQYFVGGNGDFCVVADRKEKYVYFFISTYNKDVAEQGVSVARMRYRDRDCPVGKVEKWRDGRWNEPGLGGHVTPVFPAAIDWHKPVVDAFWGPSVHFNTHLHAWVMLLNRAKDQTWAQEGVYITFNRDLSNPCGWSKPVKLLDAGQLKRSKWYPQIIGADTGKHETDKLAGRKARLFIAGLSQWQITFLRPEEKATGTNK